MYDAILARSFSRYEQKKLGYGALLGSLFIAFSFCLFFKPNFASLPAFNFRLSAGVNLKMLSSSQRAKDTVCNTMETRTDVCEINGDIRIDSRSATVFVVSPGQEAKNSSWTIRPYPRKEDPKAFKSVREWTVKSVATTDEVSDIPQCNQSHSAPAILFSAGGYSGNNFHDFTDIVIPLYLTARQFDGEVKLLITDAGHSWWIVKFQKFLKNLSRYEFINIDKDNSVHCFRSVIVGLKRHPRELMIDPSRSPYSMKDFRMFLRSSYSLPKAVAIKMGQDDEKQRPLLVIISRKRTRSFINTDEIVRTAEEVGFEVMVTEPDTSMSQFAEIVNSCDVLMGVHGAGLTNMLFLPENAVLIQVVPIGAAWVSKTCFEDPSKDMNIRYLEYKIEAEESSLIQQFPAGHEVFSNPSSIGKQGWDLFRSVYLDKQNVKVDVNRFRPTLLKALELLH
ncbi:hypothetical protein SLEP1_g34577 [Rubroshorea leprosula]|uniref:Glycosyltransferase 61 catalytic domain-containing protein n=1 Tax=Rubroshorea leprosula TaxID=152421 RepID=A0AAV5KKE9_9ROSI|nr:hypothetical protein SLEP1_g34577 [Rubroshorea leprosula]